PPAAAGGAHHGRVMSIHAEGDRCALHPHSVGRAKELTANVTHMQVAPSQHQLDPRNPIAFMDIGS
ncbi:hypothetical protein HaLaN_21227, partial [Haematococcus lacustris]